MACIGTIIHDRIRGGGGGGGGGLGAGGSGEPDVPVPGIFRDGIRSTHSVSSSSKWRDGIKDAPFKHDYHDNRRSMRKCWVGGGRRWGPAGVCEEKKSRMVRTWREKEKDQSKPVIPEFRDTVTYAVGVSFRGRELGERRGPTHWEPRRRECMHSG